MKDWQMYRKTLIPTTQPHITPNTNNLKELLKQKKALFARYTEDFDCGYETEWWYLIKDTLVDLKDFNAKNRYEIKKGLNNIEVKIIDQVFYAEDIYNVYIKAIKKYTKFTKTVIDKENFISKIKTNSYNKNIIFFGGFLKETEELIGYAVCVKKDDIVNLSSVKVNSDFLSKNINAALAFRICEYFLNELHYKYICDGERNINHDTNYQDYLIKLLGFRKAYCKLNVVYNDFLDIVVRLIYPLRGLIKNSKNNFIHNIYSVLFQEEIRRSFIK